MVEPAVNRVARVAKKRMGGTTLRLETPAARIPVISPSVDMRLRVISTPTRTPNGMVKLNVNGRARANSSPTVVGGAELRTRVSKSLLTRCRKITNVNNTVPSTELVIVSLNIDRLRIPILSSPAEAKQLAGLAFRP